MYAMRQQVVPLDFFYVCNVFDGWGTTTSVSYERRAVVTQLPGGL